MTERAVKHYKSAYVGAREKKLVTEIVTEDSETGRFLKRMEEKRLQRPCFETIDMRGKVPGECKRYVLNDRVFFLDDISYGIYQKGLAENNGVFTIGTYEAIVGGKHTYRAMREAEERERQARERLREAQGRGGAVGPSSQGGATGRREAAAEAPRRYNPETIPFGYFLRRCEERLQYVTSVELAIDGQAYQATTRDISISGLQVAFKGMLEVPEGARIRVNFTDLQEHYPKVPLAEVAYELVGQGQKDTQRLLRLRLVEAERPEGFTDFVVGLVERYRRKYKLDVEDRFCSTASWLYERIYSESMVQIPLFVRQDGEGLRADAVAATDGNRPLLNFFHTSVSSYDFSPLCLPHRLKYLAGGGEMLLALYRRRQEGVWQICSAADFELEPQAFADFVRHALSHRESCVLRVAPCALPFREANMKKFELMSVRLAEKSAEEAERLRALFMAELQLRRSLKLALIDERMALLEKDPRTGKKGYLEDIGTLPSDKLFHLSLLGIQGHFLAPSQFDWLEKQGFDVLRLGSLREDITQAEPLLRDADLLAFHLSALKMSEAPAVKCATPNGLYAEEACQLARYAGMSDKLSAFALFGLNPTLDRTNQTAQLAAQIIWYFVEGVSRRVKDYPYSTSHMTEYVVPLPQKKLLLSFWKSEKSGRWWMQVPLHTQQAEKRHRLIPCTYQDYLDAGSGELPDSIWKWIHKTP